MPIPTYTPGYPPDGSSLGQTKATIRNNLDGTFETLAVDHINNNGQPGSQPAGYHSVIHAVPQGGDPAAVTGYGQLYSKTINSVVTDQALFWETGGGIIQQLTVNLTPSASNNGQTFLPGGLIMKFGTASGSSAGAFNVTYASAFPNNLFSLNVSVAKAEVPTQYDIAPGFVTTAGFRLVIANNGAFNVYWIAIGN